MKNIRNIVDGLKLVIKYGAYVGVIINVVQYAIDQLENIDKGLDKGQNK